MLGAIYYEPICFCPNQKGQFWDMAMPGICPMSGPRPNHAPECQNRMRVPSSHPRLPASTPFPIPNITGAHGARWYWCSHGSCLNKMPHRITRQYRCIRNLRANHQCSTIPLNIDLRMWRHSRNNSYACHQGLWGVFIRMHHRKQKEYGINSLCTQVCTLNLLIRKRH